jgi:succinoglycan biosynthesis transport protein ExoP
VDVRRLIAVTRTWLPLFIASVVLAAGAAYLISNQLPKVYEARATLIVGQSLSAVNPDYNQLLVSQRLSTTYASLATFRPILDNVITALKLPTTSGELGRRVRANAPLDSTLLTITAQDGDPATAAAIANALAEELIAASPKIQGRQSEIQTFIDSEIKATQAQIQTTEAQREALNAITNRTSAQDAQLQALDGRMVTLRSTLASLLSLTSGDASNLLTVIEPAITPADSISPRPLLNTLLAAVLGLLLAAAVVLVVEYLSDGIRDAESIAEVTGLSTLGTIARMKRNKGGSEMYQLAALLYPRSGVAEAYRTLRTNIEFSAVDAPIRTLLVTSSVPGEGKTITAANLAVVFAQAGRRVLLVDADLRKPGVHRVFDLANGHGLTTLMRGDGVALDAVSHLSEQENLRILTTGPLPPNPAELVGSQRMRTVLASLQKTVDLIIVDSPPLQAVTDSAILSSMLDGTLFVIDAEHSRRRNVRASRQALAKAGATVLGAALNRVPARAASDYASYYGGYFSSDEPGARTKRAPDPTPETPVR